MRMMRYALVLVVASLVGLLNAHAADIAAGKEKAAYSM
jgi:hypothetical protein